MILKIKRDSKRAQMLLGLPEVGPRGSSQSEMYQNAHRGVECSDQALRLSQSAKRVGPSRG